MLSAALNEQISVLEDNCGLNNSRIQQNKRGTIKKRKLLARNLSINMRQRNLKTGGAAESQYKLYQNV
jgi:hypothetical protein